MLNINQLFKHPSNMRKQAGLCVVLVVSLMSSVQAAGLNICSIGKDVLSFDAKRLSGKRDLGNL